MSEEEIKQLAADAIPVYPIYADLLDGIRWQTYIDHLRMEWVKGYKAALSTPAQPVPVKPEDEKETMAELRKFEEWWNAMNPATINYLTVYHYFERYFKPKWKNQAVEGETIITPFIEKHLTRIKQLTIEAKEKLEKQTEGETITGVEEE